MTKLLLIRHGQSLANLEERFAGQWDIPLTDLGLKQAESTAKFIAENYKVDAVYASDLIRAYDTGKAVADLLGLEVIKTRGMREIHAGDWDGRKFSDLFENDENFRHWKQDMSTAQCTGGESVRQLSDRVIKEVLRIAGENDGKTVVIATHATPIRTVEQKISGRPFGHINNIPWVTNASVSEVDCINGRLYAVSISQDTHLKEKDLVSTLPANV